MTEIQAAELIALAQSIRNSLNAVSFGVGIVTGYVIVQLLKG